MTAGQLTTMVIKDRTLGEFEITGTRIGRIDTRDGAPGQNLDRPRPRWGVNTVIKLRNGEYVLVREAFSIFYHTAATTCSTRTTQQSGEPPVWQDLPDDAMPCWKCRPPAPEDLEDGELVRFEFPRRSVDQCTDATQVVSRLTTSRKASGTRTAEVPEPIRALLAQCRDNDDDFGLTAAPRVRIG